MRLTELVGGYLEYYVKGPWRMTVIESLTWSTVMIKWYCFRHASVSASSLSQLDVFKGSVNMFLAFMMSLEITCDRNYRCGRALAIDSAVVEELKVNEEQHCNADHFRRTAFICSRGWVKCSLLANYPFYLCALYFMCSYCLLCLCLSWWSGVWVGWVCCLLLWLFTARKISTTDSSRGATCTDWCGRFPVYRCWWWLCCVAMG